MTAYNDHDDAEAAAMPDDLLAELVARADAEAADERAWLADMAERDVELGPWPSDVEVAEFEAEMQRRVG